MEGEVNRKAYQRVGGSIVILDHEVKLDFQDVLIRPKRSTLESRSNVELIRIFKTKHGNEFSGIPIIASNMTTGTFDMLKCLSKSKVFTAIAKHHNKDWLSQFTSWKNGERDRLISYGIYAIGMSQTELEELKSFVSQTSHWDNRLKICIDIANGYTQRFASFVSGVRDMFPNNVLIVGNVATPEMVQELVIAGADYVKVGLGSGLECTTRFKTGVGYPQISAAIECSDAAHGLGAGIVLDGGMRCSGDIAKAFCANSDFVMLGGMFAGTDESEGEIIERHYLSDELEWVSDQLNTGRYRQKQVDKKFKLFYGMSSDYAQEAHFGGKKEYRTSEGRLEEIPYKGGVEEILFDTLGGLRSACTYIGAQSLKDMGKCATFVRVNRQHDRSY
jgi:GMP reductase